MVISKSFEGLGLSAALVRAVAEQGYTEPTPIQSQAIPVVLAGRDLLAAAQTGTGKTAGFTLPMLQRLGATQPGHRAVRALILVPTRELAAQVRESVRTYGRHQPLRTAVIFGGVGINPQIDELRRGVDIVVATPGRLLDHLQQKTVSLDRVEILVLDEADRMLDMGFIPDVRRILAQLPKERQNLLFSATFPEEIRKLAASFMRDPATVEVARRNTPAELVAQVAHPVDAGRKRALLAHLVKSNDWRQVLVFTRTKHGANRLAEQLSRDGIEADAIHGNKSQNARTRTLKRFKDNELRVLVATDIAARGLDIESLPHVVNFDLPHVPEDYVHRIGRTGRAGSSGEAVSLVSQEERPLLAAIEKLMNRSVESRTIPGFEPGRAQAKPEPRHEPQMQRRPEKPRHQQPRRSRPRRHGELRIDRGAEFEAQIREARMRAREEARTEPYEEPPPPPAAKEPRQPVVTKKKQRAVLLGTPRDES
ncbi:MAG TPA: DEAD/DEAH box helicase [Burkholderiales bacterium]|nr:DEAD/DEAH box helicase [Burkholderiales bacterium]